MRILVIDDDATVRFMLGEICEAAGWAVEMGSNGKEGLDVFNIHKFDVVLVDYHMPEMDGLVTVQEIRKLDVEIPILVLTVDERQEIADRFLDNGATDFALKPVKAPDLISRIQLHIRLSQLTRSAHSHNREQRTDDGLEPGLYAIKGIGKNTLEHIVKYLRTVGEPSTIDQITKEVGLAYPTVYRTLTHLMQKGKVRTIISYQKVGRPKNRYEWFND
ncbi:response regulator [Aneurinibacillus sp. Ricciae_BoGa-3]|uniref:response regulator n=1 Tax=Aneurinibacillus sp. Ricciae_BoGa-3 TaxID=3022697 RepID=UPI00234142D2|nr:response regulator [Aneurinibacillus sp. Ricciae_BoGa-3]WCK53480.1 response regulator [Aneurinibacillus sp. Ricciae_BoGa-3]